jgi:hypothetical protein
VISDLVVLKVLFTLCLTNESFFVLLYLIYHAELGGNIAATVRLLAARSECSSEPLTIIGAVEGRNTVPDLRLLPIRFHQAVHQSVAGNEAQLRSFPAHVKG